MQLRVGQTLESVVDATSVVVVRGPSAEVTVTCGGRAMAVKGEAGERVAGLDGADGAGLQLGKRYTVGELELLCVKGGEHTVAVDGDPVVPKTAQPLPASD